MKPKKKQTKVNFIINTKDFEEFKIICMREKVFMSDLFRELIENKIKEYKHKK